MNVRKFVVQKMSAAAAVAALLLLTGSVSAQTYSITTGTYPDILGGSATGGGLYSHGATVTLTASPAVGYDFGSWTVDYNFHEGGLPVSSNETYSFVAERDRIYYANFTRKQYTITASANPVDGGSVTGGSTHNHGANVTLTASPEVGYDFVNWTENGSIVSTSKAYGFTVSSARTLVANFALKVYEFPFQVADHGTGSITATIDGAPVTSPATIKHGESVTLTASPAAGYYFVEWRTGTATGAIVSTSAQYTFTFNVHTQILPLIAKFARIQYVVAAAAYPSAGGSVTGGGTYNHGANVTLTASPAAGYDFVNWTEGGTAVSTSASYQFTATGARTLVANFVSNAYSVQFSAGDNGTLTATVDGAYATSPASVAQGKSVVFYASPYDGYEVLEWKLNGVPVVGQGTTFTLPSVSAAAVVSVSFTAISSIASNDRVVTVNNNDNGAAVVIPINTVGFELSVGPNPARKSDDKSVNIFITGKRVDKGELTVYDGVGNVINKITINDDVIRDDVIRDNVVGATAPGRPLSGTANPARRIIGKWDLRDTKNRPVSDGTYLIRGVIKTADGKREKVSIVVGVR